MNESDLTFHQRTFRRFSERFAAPSLSMDMSIEQKTALKNTFSICLKEKAARQTIGQFVIDYLRKCVGDSRTAGFHQKRDLELAREIEPNRDASAMRSDVRDVVDDRLTVIGMLDKLRGRRRTVAELYYLDGWKLGEIAEEFNFTESRASALLAEAVRDIRKKRAREMSLTKSEFEICKLISKGLSNKEIGDRLCVTDKTVKFHITNIYPKVGVATRSQFMAMFPDGTTPESNEMKEVEVSDWQPINTPKVLNPTPQTITASGPTGQEQVTFVVNTFKIDRTMGHLQTMSEEVTKGDYTVDKVMAACQCIGRMNETIQTVMKAAQVLKVGR